MAVEEQVDRPPCGLGRHRPGLAAERPLLGVAVRAAEVALLRHGQRQGVDRRALQRAVVDRGRGVEAEVGQHAPERVGVARLERGADGGRRRVGQVVEAGPVHDEQLGSGAVVEQVHARVARA